MLTFLHQVAARDPETLQAMASAHISLHKGMVNLSRACLYLQAEIADIDEVVARLGADVADFNARERAEVLVAQLCQERPDQHQWQARTSAYIKVR